MSVDARQLQQLVRDLEQSRATLPNQLRDRLLAAMRELLAIEQGVVHVKSGDLRDSLHIIEPSTIGNLTTSILAPDVSYAALEADRGGPHDFPAVTLEQGDTVIQALRDDVAALVAGAFVGVGHG